MAVQGLSVGCLAPGPRNIGTLSTSVPAYLGSPEDKQGWSRKVQETSPQEPISDTLAHKPSQPLEAGTYEEGKALSQVRVLCSGTEGRE